MCFCILVHRVCVYASFVMNWMHIVGKWIWKFIFTLWCWLLRCSFNMWCLCVFHFAFTQVIWRICVCRCCPLCSVWRVQYFKSCHHCLYAPLMCWFLSLCLWSYSNLLDSFCGIVDLTTVPVDRAASVFDKQVKPLVFVCWLNCLHVQWYYRHGMTHMCLLNCANVLARISRVF